MTLCTNDRAALVTQYTDMPDGDARAVRPLMKGMSWIALVVMVCSRIGGEFTTWIVTYTAIKRAGAIR